MNFYRILNKSLTDCLSKLADDVSVFKSKNPDVGIYQDPYLEYLIKYRHICIVHGTDNQYVNDKHFLAYVPHEFSLIYSFSNGDKDVSIAKGSDVKINYIVKQAYLILFMNKSLVPLFNIICDRSCAKANSEKDLELAVRSRSVFVISKWFEDNQKSTASLITLINLSFKHYYPWILTLSKGCEDISISMIVGYLSDRKYFSSEYIPENPSQLIKYNDEVNTFDLLRNEYISRILSINISNIEIKCLMVLMDILNTDYYNMFGIRIDISLLTKNSHRFNLLGRKEKLYILGLDINGYDIMSAFDESAKLLTEEDLFERFKIVEDKGVEAYSAMHSEEIKKYLNVIIGKDKHELVNETDSMMEEITSYGYNDFIIHKEGNKLYAFTRPEFNTLLKKRKNIWTNVDITDETLETITKISVISKDLPKAKPVADLLNDFMNGNLEYPKPEEDKDVEDLSSVSFVAFMNIISDWSSDSDDDDSDYNDTTNTNSYDDSNGSIDYPEDEDLGESDDDYRHGYEERFSFRTNYYD